LREVGGSLGVSEDTAQKRVATALERLTGFFQRRGFRTAGAATAAAALQSAATAAPAAVAQGVIQAALHSAPAVATGLTALLARIVALPKTQTIAVCVVLALAPATVEWSKANAANKRAGQIQAAIEAARAQSDEITAETERIRNRFADAETKPASPTALGVERKEAAARNFAALKLRLAGLGSAGPYTWPDDLPFVRVPKSALKNISSDVPGFGATGRLAPWIKEVLNLPERQVADVESHLSDHLSAMDRLASNRAIETNWVDSFGTYYDTVRLPALGPEGQSLEDALSTNLVQMLGTQQAKAVLSPFSSPDQWLSMEKVSHFLIKEEGEFMLSVKPSETGAPTVSMAWQKHLATGGPLDLEHLPPFLADRFVPWLEQNGLTNGVFRTMPQ
jgi:hypothetical protein